MEVIWTEPALSDLQTQIAYLLDRNPSAAYRVEATVIEAVERLVDLPHRGRQGRREGTRELVIGGLPYIVVYRVRDASIRILRVFHSAQNRPPEPG